MKLYSKLYLRRLERKGFRHGDNFSMEKACNIDSRFAGLISCGDNVTLTRHVYILAHDASMKKFLGKTRVAPVSIGSNVFIGTYSTIAPGVSIGDNCIVAAHSYVNKSIPDGEVWGGCPARYIMQTDDFIKKHMDAMDSRTYCRCDEGLKHRLLSGQLKDSYID